MWKSTKPHESPKALKNTNFDIVWARLQKTKKEIPLTTEDEHDFTAYARYPKFGKRQKERVIVIRAINRDIQAYIYPCCWGYTTNCGKTWIGGYSEAIDDWIGK